MDSDQVLVMDAGLLVEFGHPHKLLENNLGFFSKMVEEAGPSISTQLRAIAKSTFNIMEVDEETDKSDNGETTRL